VLFDHWQRCNTRNAGKTHAMPPTVRQNPGVDPQEARLHTMQRAAAGAARVLAEIWPQGRATVMEHDVHSMGFAVEMECDGVRVRRIADLRDSLLYDTISLGDRPPHALPGGARVLDPGPEVAPRRVAVDLPKAHRWSRRPRPMYWTEDEIESLSRRLNEIDEAVLGVVESRCRVCGLDESDERFVGGSPQYVICHCCESESGVDDSTPAEVARARRAWVEGGRQWRYPKERPADWDPDAALAALLSKWRDL
jgi:hypothetical protein